MRLTSAFAIRNTNLNIYHMRHSLLFRGPLALAALATASLSHADTQAYFFEEMGEVMGVSDNGNYVAISDEDNLIGYIWHADNPTEIENITISNKEEGLPSGQTITGVSVMDLTNDGMAVGSVYYKDGKQKAAYYLDGEWKYLPLHPNVMNNTQAIAVTPDGKTIAGYQFISAPDSEIKGRYYPCQWTKNAEGGYDMNVYTSNDYLSNQGYWPMTQNVEGTIIGGMLYTDVGGSVPALIKEGELITFNEFETRNEPFEYKGEVLGWYETYYVDNYREGQYGDDWFVGAFDNCDADGHFYGMRTVATDVNADGSEGTLTNVACIYDMNTDQFIDDDKISLYTAGLGTDVLFTGSASVVLNGENKKLPAAFGFSTTRSLAGVAKISIDGKVLGAIWQEPNPATGEYTYYPFVIVLDQPLAAVNEIIAGDDRCFIIVADGRIEVAGEAEAEVYTLDGHLAGQGKSVEVAPGIYAGTAGRTSRTVVVK